MRLGFSQDKGVDVHPVLGPVKFQVREIGSEPDGQVTNTVAVMRDRVAEDAARPEFKDRVERLIPPGQDLDRMESAYSHVKRSIKFQRDEQTGAGIGVVPESELVEVIVRPVDMASYVDQGVAVGDCDDFAMYLAAILSCLGVPCAFVTVAASAAAPDQFSHVYVVAYPKDDSGSRIRVALDASHGDYPGWEVPNRFGKLEEWPVEDWMTCWLQRVVLWGGLGAAVWYGAKAMRFV